MSCPPPGGSLYLLMHSNTILNYSILVKAFAIKYGVPRIVSLHHHLTYDDVHWAS